MEELELARLIEWSAALECITYYEMLGLSPTADTEAVRAAYHRFAASFHPDAYPDESAQVTDLLSRVFRNGTQAYRVLIDADLRLKYDMGLQRGQLRLDERASSGPPVRRATEGRPLHELCRSAGAKLAAKQADKLLSAGDLRGARKQLEIALSYDGGANLDIAERLEALAVALYASGA